MKSLWMLCLAVALFVTPRLANAAGERAPGTAELGTPDRVSVLTMGPGDHPFARFGHNALLLEWQGERLGLVYNFGTFAFDGLQGVQDFMAGRFRYWLSISSLPRTLRVYASYDRSVVAQDLNLTEAQRAEIAEALEVNALPQNRYYDYDYYYDNCSTRVRDVVDRVLRGQLQSALRGAGRYSFRGHTERLTADAFWLYLGLDLALGPLTDRPTTRWNELFIPGELRSALASASVERGGQRVPVVARERVLVTSTRAPERAAPPQRVLGFALAGVLLGAAFAALGQLGATNRPARVAFAVSTALVGLVLGLLGTVFVVFWAFTKHWSAFQNYNILVCTPWSLVLVGTAVGVIRGRAKSLRLHHRLIQLSTLSAAAAVLLALIPDFGQDNTRVAALLGPLWLGMYLGALRLVKNSVRGEVAKALEPA